MISRKIWGRLSDAVEPKGGDTTQLIRTIDDIEARITESPPEPEVGFKALDLNGLTLSFDADVVHIVYGYDGLTYVTVMGNLIVLYDKKEDLNGFLFSAESVQKIKMKDRTA